MIYYCAECGNDAHEGACDPVALKAMYGPLRGFLTALLATKPTLPPGQARPERASSLIVPGSSQVLAVKALTAARRTTPETPEP